MKRVAFLVSLVFVLSSLFSLHASAQFNTVLPEICDGDADNSAACNEIERGVNDGNPVTSTTQNIVNIISLVVGIAAVVVILVAGITMALSQGDSGKIKNSRDAIIYAAVGLVVVALARSIVFFIVNRVR